MSADDTLRQQLLALLRGGNAHMTLDEAVADFPEWAINQCPPNVDYTPWALLEHLRIAQSDILEFVRDPGYSSPPWPEGYWPLKDYQASPQEWRATLDAIRLDLGEVITMVNDPTVDLLAPLPHAPDYTLLREILLVADHNAYHIGELAVLRQVMNTW